MFAGLITVLLCVISFHKGMTKAIGDLVAWIVALLVIALIAVIYVSAKGEEVKFTVAGVIILLLVGMIYGLIHFVFKTIKMIAKLPVFCLLDHLLGLAVGLAESIILLWAVYLIGAVGLLGSVGEMVYQDTANSQILSFLSRYNYLAEVVLNVIAG